MLMETVRLDCQDIEHQFIIYTLPEWKVAKCVGSNVVNGAALGVKVI